MLLALSQMAEDHPLQRMKKLRKSPKYPIGTLAAYGPDNTRATKLVASVFRRPGQRDPDELHRWFINEGDIRNNPGIAEEIAEFFKSHRVKETAVGDCIMGCPHEEGIDYPMGRTCPHCPFWANIDRFTLEPIRPPAPTRSPEQILKELSVERDTQPLEALESADAHREALTEPLLQTLEHGLADPSGTPEGEATLFSYAMYLFAKWRETRAYPLIIRWLSLPGESAFDIGGDTVTLDGGRILASVFDGNLEPIQSLILNRDANEYCRSESVRALALLAIWAEVPRDTVEEHFLSLAHEGLEREHSFVWNELAAACADMEALRAIPELRRAYEAGLIDPGVIPPKELDKVEAGPRGRWIERQREQKPPITDVGEATAWWRHSAHEPRTSAEELARIASNHTARVDPAIARSGRKEPKIGRNDSCPCGSGKKYKKCCGK
jgi:hypothetical protein